MEKFKKPKMTNFETEFLIPKTKKAFTHLQKAFTKVPILYDFDLECYIYIKTNAFG